MGPRPGGRPSRPGRDPREELGGPLEHLHTIGSLPLLVGALLVAGLGVPIPEDPLILGAGVLAHRSDLPWWVVLGAAYASAITADCSLFFFARRFGEPLLARWPFRWLASPLRQLSAANLFSRFGGRAVFVGRHLPGLRPLVFLLAGFEKMPLRTFLLWDALAALITIPALFACGYFFSAHVDRVENGLADVEHWVAAIGVVVVLTVWLLRSRRFTHEGQSREINISRTHYELAGEDAAPVVVLIPGATLPLAVWDPLVGPLAKGGLRVVRYDLPGRGQTPIEGLGTSFDAHVAQLDALLDSLPAPGPVGLIALASGALVAAEFAAHNPRRVSRVALIAPDGAATRFTGSERLLALPGLGPLLFRLRGRQTLLGRVPRYTNRPDVQEFVRTLLTSSMESPTFRTSVLETVRTFPFHNGQAVYTELSRAGTPTCVIWGADDAITPPVAADAMRALFGDEAVHVLDGVGHLPFAEDPEGVAALLCAHFAGGVRRPATSA